MFGAMTFSDSVAAVHNIVRVVSITGSAILQYRIQCIIPAHSDWQLKQRW